MDSPALGDEVFELDDVDDVEAHESQSVVEGRFVDVTAHLHDALESVEDPVDAVGHSRRVYDMD